MGQNVNNLYNYDLNSTRWSYMEHFFTQILFENLAFEISMLSGGLPKKIVKVNKGIILNLERIRRTQPH